MEIRVLQAPDPAIMHEAFTTVALPGTGTSANHRPPRIRAAPARPSLAASILPDWILPVPGKPFPRDGEILRTVFFTESGTHLDLVSIGANSTVATSIWDLRAGKSSADPSGFPVCWVDANGDPALRLIGSGE